MKKTIPAAGLLIAFLASCATTPGPRHRAGELYGMIYDGDNKPVYNAAVYVNGDYAASSDIHGHFTIPRVKPRLPCLILARKPDYETIETTFADPDPAYVLYMRMFSSDQLLTGAEKALKEKNWNQAESWLARAEAAGGDAPSTGYLRGILAFYTNRYAEAAIILEEVVEAEKSAAFGYLVLADLYQYHLEDQEQARNNLERFLSLQYDPELRRRLDTLAGTESRGAEKQDELSPKPAGS
jgi:tetratricopeptide (TPR) repeat protein